MSSDTQNNKTYNYRLNNKSFSITERDPRGYVTKFAVTPVRATYSFNGPGGIDKGSFKTPLDMYSWLRGLIKNKELKSVVYYLVGMYESK